MRDEAVRFIVTGLPRCGSTLLVKSLHAHPRVFCDGELLLGHSWKAKRLAKANDKRGDYSTDCPSKAWRWVGETLFTPLRTWQFQAVGFKFLYPQIQKQKADTDLVRDRIKVIRIWRNPLACAVSAFQCRRDDVWHSDQKVGRKPDQSPIDVPLNAVIHRADTQNTWIARMDAVEIEVLRVTYRELTADYHVTMDKCFAFLVADPCQLAKPPIRKLRTERLEKRCRNFCALRNRAPAKYRRYFEEELL